MQIERNEIRVFSAVVEEGGFSRAAERLNRERFCQDEAFIPKKTCKDAETIAALFRFASIRVKNL